MSDIPSPPAPIPPPTLQENRTVEAFAIASLVLGIVGACSMVVFPLFVLFINIPGIVFGHIARARIRKNPQLTGDGMALAGLIIGYVFLVLFVVLVSAAVAYFLYFSKYTATLFK